jgi:hypothetical protein
MTFVSLPHTLTPGTPENVAHVQNNFAAIRDVVNGGLDSTNLAPGGVSATSLAASAKVLSGSANAGTATATGSSYGTVGTTGLSFTVTPTVDSAVVVNVSFFVAALAAEPSGRGFDARVLVDGVQQKSITMLDTTSAFDFLHMPFLYRGTLSAGSRTVTIQVRTAASGVVGGCNVGGDLTYMVHAV